MPVVSARDPYLDNVKFLAMVLVVVGHFWTALRGEHLVASAYLLLYLFHMPVFVFLAGLTASTGTISERRLRGLVTGIAVPYLLFQTAYEVAGSWLVGERELDLLAPPWLMWFLAALFVWRLTAPIWGRLRGGVGIAVAISLVGGLTSAADLALAQVLGLLPFFVLGLKLDRVHLHRLARPVLRVPATVVFGAAAVACWTLVPRVDMEWIYWRSSYDQLGVGLTEGAVARAGLLVVALVLSAAFLILVPRRRYWFTRLGERTMYAYLLHGFTVLTATTFGLFDRPVLTTLPGLVVLTVAAAGFACLLMSGPVRRAWQPVVEPTLDWLWRPEPAVASGERVPDHVEDLDAAGLDVRHGNPRDRIGAPIDLDHPRLLIR